MKWTSNAEWPREAYANGVSTDTHDTLEQALAVCSRLEREGFGGDRVHFPLRTWVEEADQEATPDLDLSQFEGMTPGPWKCNLHNPAFGGLYHGDIEADLGEERTRTVAVVLKYATQTEREANARAIAAVPSLIAEVKQLREERDTARSEAARYASIVTDDAHIDDQMIAHRARVAARIMSREQLMAKDARIAELERDRERLARGLCFFSSVIHSGESWSPVCQEVLDSARAAMQTNPER